LPISGEIRAPQIRQQSTPFADHLQQATATMVILGVLPEMIGETVDPLRQCGNLHRDGTGVSVVLLELENDRLLVKVHELCILTKLREPNRVSFLDLRQLGNVAERRFLVKSAPFPGRHEPRS
jgi:energy-converting hydrogenase Eha subunit E